MTAAARKEHCFYCFDVLLARLSKSGSASVPEPAFPNAQFPLFVTWTVAETGHLRGCIGNFSPMWLHSGLGDALQDTRFSPITSEEVPHLSCGVSLLTDFEPAKSWDDWEVGRHGIRIVFADERGVRRSATYLPEVAEEQRWTKTEAIDSLLRKGGFRGRITPAVRQSVSLTRYQSSKTTATFAEFEDFTRARAATAE